MPSPGFPIFSISLFQELLYEPKTMIRVVSNAVTFTLTHFVKQARKQACFSCGREIIATKTAP